MGTPLLYTYLLSPRFPNSTLSPFSNSSSSFHSSGTNLLLNHDDGQHSPVWPLRILKFHKTWLDTEDLHSLLLRKKALFWILQERAPSAFKRNVKSSLSLRLWKRANHNPTQFHQVFWRNTFIHLFIHSLFIGNILCAPGRRWTISNK